MASSTNDWFSNEAFWEASYDLMFPRARFEAAADEFAAVLDLVGGDPRSVVDVACGPGRHAVAAAQRGMDVVGVDATSFLLGKARELAAREGVDVEWVHSDMREHVQEPAVDLVLNLFTSFGYFDDDQDNARVLRNAYDSLRPGGSLVLDVMGKEVLARIFRDSSVEDAPDGFVVQRRRVTEDWSRIENEWALVRGDTVRSFRLGHWIYSGRELAGMLTEAGFSEVDLFGGLGGSRYGPEASRLVAVARRT